MSDARNKKRKLENVAQPLSLKKAAIPTPAEGNQFRWEKRSLTDNENTIEIGEYFSSELSSSSQRDVGASQIKHTGVKKLAIFTVLSILATTGKSELKNDEDWIGVKDPLLDKIRDLHRDGFTILFLDRGALNGKVIASILKKVIPILAERLGVPSIFMFSTRVDLFNKPSPGLFHRFISRHGEIDSSKSFIVGELDIDRKLASNLGLPYHTPSEFFHNALVSERPDFLGFDFKNYNHNIPFTSPSDAVICSKTHVNVEVVIFTGYPGAGKSSLFRKYFEKNNYVWVNQDTLKTRPKCLNLVKSTLKENKFSVVVDNTSRDIATRKIYLDLKEQFPQVKFRSINFVSELVIQGMTNELLALQTARYRALSGAPNLNLPLAAFTSFTKSYQKPTLEEGFDEVISINFKFEGTEEEKLNWSQWLI